MTSYNTPLPLESIVTKIVMGEEKGIHLKIGFLKP
jgi:hypothetical protein